MKLHLQIRGVRLYLNLHIIHDLAHNILGIRLRHACELLQECGGQLGTDAAQFQNLLAGLREQSMAQRETPLVEVSQEEGSPESKAADLSEGGLSDLTEADGLGDQRIRILHSGSL